MKRKEKESFKNMSAVGLGGLVQETHEKIMLLGVKRYTQAPKNSRERKMLRKKLALVKTHLRLQQLGVKL